VDDGAGAANQRCAVAAADWESVGGAWTPELEKPRRCGPRAPIRTLDREQRYSDQKDRALGKTEDTNLEKKLERGSDYQLLWSKQEELKNPDRIEKNSVTIGRIEL